MSAQPEVLAALHEALFADPSLKAYAVIDGDARHDLPDLLSDVEHTCLFVGAIDPEVAAVAPWLVLLHPGSPLVAALASGWGRSEAIFVLSRSELLALRRHLRTLTLAKVPGGHTVYFRFYDPRVLRDVVPVMTAAQRQKLLGTAVEALLCEEAAGKSTAGLWWLRRDRP